MTSLLNINSDGNSINSSVSEVQLSDEQIREYQDILNLLADENVIAYGYLLEETIRLTEGLVDRQITNEVVINFVSRAAIHISNRRWIHYGNSTARLELHLRAMSSVLHTLIANESNPMIEADARDTLYKSVSKFWATYRTSKVINANITFSLREIRTCLRKIKDDHNHVLGVTFNIVDVVSNIVTKDYWAAFVSFIKILDFEYPAGEWFYGWKEIRVEFLKLRQQLSEIDESEKSGRVTEFYKRLHKLSTDEFEKVKKKNTKFRNFEHKMLKSGGSIAGCSLPDHIDTLLIGYLELIQRMLTEFVPQMSIHTQEIIGFCNEIYESHVKKQLTCKAVEVLYVTKKFYRGRQVKNMIKVNFKFRRPNLKLDSSSRLNRQQDTPLATPTSANISMISQEKQKRKNRFHTIRNAIVIKSNFREIPTKVKTNIQKIRQKQASSLRDRIVDNVNKLMKEKTTIVKVVQEIKEIKEKQYNELSEDKFDKDAFLLDFKKLLKEREELKKESSLNNLPETPRVGRSNSYQDSLLNHKFIKFFEYFKRNAERNIEENENNKYVDTPLGKGGKGNSDIEKVEEKHPNNEISNITIEEIEIIDNISPKEKEDPSAEEVKNIDDSDQEVDKYITFDKVEEKHPNNEISNITNEEIEHNDNILPKEKEDPSEEEVKKIDDSDQEVDKYISFDKVEEKHPNNEISYITNEEIEHNDNISPKEKEDPSAEEVKKFDDSDHEVDKYITFEEVEEILKHQNDLDNEDTLTTSYLINDENEPVERIKLINKYSQCGEENHHITIDEDVECCHMQHMDSVELEEILGYQKYMDEHISDDVVVKEDVQDLIISTETPKPKENIFEVEFEELYLDNCKFPTIDLPPPYEELSSFKSNDVNFNEFKIFILTHHQVDSSNPLWNVDNVQDFEEMCSKTFKDFNIKVQYANFINNVQYNQIKRINPSYEQAPSYEQLSSSKSNEVNFNEFKKFLLEHHKIDSSHQLWKIDNLKDFEELYSKTFSNSSPQDRYTNFVNNVQQNIVINIIEKQNPSELESSFKTFISFIENIVENISVGNNAAKRKSHISEKS